MMPIFNGRVSGLAAPFDAEAPRTIARAAATNAKLLRQELNLGLPVRNRGMISIDDEVAMRALRLRGYPDFGRGTAGQLHGECADHGDRLGGGNLRGILAERFDMRSGDACLRCSGDPIGHSALPTAFGHLPRGVDADFARERRLDQLDLARLRRLEPLFGRES